MTQNIQWTGYQVKSRSFNCTMVTDNSCIHCIRSLVLYLHITFIAINSSDQTGILSFNFWSISVAQVIVVLLTVRNADRERYTWPNSRYVKKTLVDFSTYCFCNCCIWMWYSLQKSTEYTTTMEVQWYGRTHIGVNVRYQLLLPLKRWWIGKEWEGNVQQHWSLLGMQRWKTW